MSNSNNWIQTEGRGCPVHPGTIVEAKSNAGLEVFYARDLNWNVPQKFRIVEAVREPAKATMYGHAHMMWKSMDDCMKMRNMVSERDRCATDVAVDLIDGAPQWATLRVVR